MVTIIYIISKGKGNGETMGKNILNMNEDDMQATAQQFQNCFNSTTSAKDSMNGKFTGMQTVGFDASIISKQLSSLANSMLNVKTTLSKHSSEMFDMDRQMAQKAEGIEIPQDFVVNDQTATNDFKQILLEKMDGKSVNEGNNTSVVDATIDSSVRKENLGNINNNNQTKEEQLASINGAKENFGNINNNNQTKEEHIADINSIGKIAIENIDNRNSLQNQEINDSSSIAFNTLGNINNSNDINRQDIADINNISKKAISNINSNKELSEQRLSDIANINRENLASINGSTNNASLNNINFDDISNIAKVNLNGETNREVPPANANDLNGIFNMMDDAKKAVINATSDIKDNV